jgi:hypothetical protein
MPPAKKAAVPDGQTVLRLGSGSTSDVTVLGAPLAGGAAYADVVSEADPSAFFPKKHLGPTQYEDVILTLGDAATIGLLDWIRAAWAPNPHPLDGAVLDLDRQMNITSQTMFSASVISETRFPALDAVNPQLGAVVLQVVPMTVDTATGSGSVSPVPVQTRWRSVNFRLQFDGVDTSGVTRIEAFTVRRKVEKSPSASGNASLVARDIDIPNLAVTVAALRAQDWRAWHRKVVIEGQQGAGAERDGALIFLSPNLATELSRIQLRNVGISKLQTIDPAHVSAQLYCEQMALVLPATLR